ncbi:(deoxy)nucleoside triphosphate pyrophosphohydrolase [Qipengyuania vulgaris]
MPEEIVLENNPTWMPVVALALEDGEGRWLMHKRPKHKHHGGLWEFPGGKVELNETPTNALVREIEEELAVVLPPDTLVPEAFAQQEPAKHECPIVILLYNCRLPGCDPRSMEGGEVGWFTPKEIDALDKPPLDQDLARSLFAKMPD